MSVIEETQTLANFVLKVMETKSLTAREVERKSGHTITHSYVNKIKNGDSTNPSPAILQALAKGIDEPEEIIFALVRGKSADLTKIANERFASISEGYADLPEQERKTLEPLLKAIELTIMSESKNKSVKLNLEAKFDGKINPKVNKPAKGKGIRAKMSNDVEAGGRINPKVQKAGEDKAQTIKATKPSAEKLNYSGAKSTRPKQSKEEALEKEIDRAIDKQTGKKR